MRISQLHLLSYGPFTGREIDFSRTGFNLIYGPNEGGKSSALRAINSLFFGIPSRTSDDFIHRKTELLVGAAITNEEGRELSFARRKKIKGSLITLDDAAKVLPDNVLDDFLKGTEKQRFIDIYCINHEQFRDGGNLMLELKGLADDSLLVASNSANFPSLQNNLRESIGQLYASRKRSSQLLSGIAAYQEAKKQKAELEVSVKKWQTLHQEKTTLEEQKSQVVEQRTKLDTEKRKLDRMRTALPKIADWKRRNEELGGKASLLLPTSYDIQERQDCYASLNTAVSRLKDFDEELCELQSGLQDIKESPDLIAIAVQIDDLQQRIGGQLQEAEAREGKTQQRELAERDVKRLLAESGSEIEFGNAASLRIPREQRSTIQSLATNEKQLRDQARRLRTEIAKTKQAMEGIEEQLEKAESLQDVRDLSNELKLAERQAGVEDEIRNQQIELKKLEGNATRKLVGLPYWNGSLDQLVKAKVPLQETISRYASSFVRLDEQQNALDHLFETKSKELNELQQQIAASKRATAVVTEENLHDARAEREVGWQLIKKTWGDGKQDAAAVQQYAGPSSLDTKYEENVSNADNLADRLRREADRVAKLAQQEEREDALGRQVAKLTSEKEELSAEQIRQRAEWQAQWKASGIDDAQTPDEMAAWLKQRADLLQIANEIESLRQELEQNQARHQSASHAVAKQLAEFDVNSESSSLSRILLAAQELIADQQEKQAVRKELESNLMRLRQEFEQLKTEEKSASEELEHWQTGWASAMNWINCQPVTTAVQARTRLEGIEELTNRFEDWTKLNEQIEANDAASKRFSDDVAKTCQRVAIEVGDTSSIELAQNLKRLLDEARTRDQAARQKRDAIEKQTQKMKQLKQESTDLDRKLREFLRTAEVESHEELLKVEALSLTSQQRQSAEDEIRNIAGSVNFDDFLQQADGKDEAELEANIDRLNVDIKELDHKRDEIVARINEVANAMEEIDGNDSAAHADQLAMNRLSHVHEVAGRYIRLKIAETILRQQVERYREENKDPLLAKASEYFAAMTCNEFTGLQIDYDEKDGRPIVVGVRADTKKTVDVNAMSDGTRDPMFLALRLAYLQRRMGQYEPMPFIVDDILIHLDDQRALATLRVLVELSEQMQVLFFTHHERLRELAEKNLSSDQLTVHELEKTNVRVPASPRKPK